MTWGARRTLTTGEAHAPIVLGARANEPRSIEAWSDAISLGVDGRSAAVMVVPSVTPDEAPIVERGHSAAAGQSGRARHPHLAPVRKTALEQALIPGLVVTCSESEAG